MNSKDYYRNYFAALSVYVKITPILKEMGLTTSNYYRFMKGRDFDSFMSDELLESIKLYIQDILSNLT